MTEHNQQTASADIPPPVAMLQLIAGFWVSHAIYIAAKLGIADLLKDQPQRSSVRWLTWAVVMGGSWRLFSKRTHGGLRGAQHRVHGHRDETNLGLLEHCHRPQTVMRECRRLFSGS